MKKAIPTPANSFQPKSSKMIALDNACNNFIELLDEYARKEQLDKAEISYIKRLIQKAYLQKKAKYFLEEKLQPFESYLNQAFQSVLNENIRLHDWDNLQLQNNGMTNGKH